MNVTSCDRVGLFWWFGGAAIISTAFLVHPTAARAAGTYVTFEGEKSAWHDGFDRFDFVMDEETLAIKPFKAPEGEKFGVRDPAKGQRRCIVIVPKQTAPGQPWSWRGCYWDHQPQTEVELLRRGFHIACIYAENPVLSSFMSKTSLLDNLASLAKAGVPLLHVCGSLDP